MSRTSPTRTLIRGRVARATRLDSCANPMRGEYNQVVTNGVATAEFTPTTTDTEEIRVIRWDGSTAAYEPSIQEFAGYGVNLTFTGVEFDLFNIVTGQPLVFDDEGNVVGIDIDTKIKLSDVGFALEIFMGVGAEDTCAPGEEPTYGYLIAPRLQGGILGDFSVSNGAISFTVTGAVTRDGNAWGSGPYKVDRTGGVPSTLFQPLSPTAALRLMTTTVAPPAPLEGARPVLDVDLAAFTGLTVSEGATPLTAEFDPVALSVGPTWYEFGDGTWDYVDAPGTTDHVYDSPGVYTVRATQNGSDWRSATVTVPFP